MDSLLDSSTSSTGGLVQVGAATKVVEEEECKHQATPINDAAATAQAATKKVVAKDKGGNDELNRFRIN